MILGRRLGLLWRANASGKHRSIRLWGWGDLESWGIRLLRRRVVGGLRHLVVHVLGLLRALVDKVALLTSHRIVARVDTWLRTHDWRDDWLHGALDLLLLIHVLWRDGWRSELLLHLISHTQIHALELLSRSLDVDKLLLETLLLLSEIHIGSNQLSIQVGVHLFLAVLINVDFRRSENLLRGRIHLAVVHLVVSTLLAGKDGRFWPTVISLVSINACSKPGIMLQLRRWCSRREVTGSGGFWCCPQARK